MSIKVTAKRRGTPAGSATYSAAYRSGTNIEDQYVTGKLNIYGWRRDIEHTQIVLPSQFAQNDKLNWARDRPTLWNQVERAEPLPSRQGHTRESYKKALRPQVVAWETVAKTTEHLNHEQRVALVLQQARYVADRYQVAVDIGMHVPRPGRARFHHVHMMFTPKEVTPEGWGSRVNFDFAEIRQAWRGFLTNAMAKAGYSLKETRPYFSFGENGQPKQKYLEELRAKGIDPDRQRSEDRKKTRPNAFQRRAAAFRRRAIPELRIKFNPTPKNQQQGTDSLSQTGRMQGLEAWIAHRRHAQPYGKQTEAISSKSLEQWIESRRAAQQNPTEQSEQSLRKWVAYRQRAHRDTQTQERSEKSLRDWIKSKREMEIWADASAAESSASKETTAERSRTLSELAREKALQIWMEYRNNPAWAKMQAARREDNTRNVQNDYNYSPGWGLAL